MISFKDNLRRSLLLAASCLAVLFATAASASAASLWEIHSHHQPSSFEPGGMGEFHFFVNNVGDEPFDGPVTLEIDLPEGTTTRFGPAGFFENSVWAPRWSCSGMFETGASSVTCTSNTDPAKFETGRVVVFVDVAADAEGPLVAEATMTSGTETVVATHAAPVGSEPSEFGIVPGSYEVDAFDEEGLPERQAGSHPDRAIAGFDFNSALQGYLASPPVETVRHLEVIPPIGFAGNPHAVPQCPNMLFRGYQYYGLDTSGTTCPPNTQVGMIQYALQSFLGPRFGSGSQTTAVYNLEPPKDVLAVFGFQINGVAVYIQASLDPRDNSVVTHTRNISEALPVSYQRLTLWGVPGDPRHDDERWNPSGGGSFGATFEGPVRPFLSLGTECNVPGTTKLKSSSWDGSLDPAAGQPPYESEAQELNGCNQLEFEPTIRALPTTNLADAPSGLEFEMEIPQDEDPKGLATAHLKDAKVTLPEGMTVNPPSADGLGACSLEQIGIDASGTPTSFIKPNGVEQATPDNCPVNSKIGTVEVETPAVDHPLPGSVYLAEQNRNPFNSLIALYLVIDDPETGVLVKLPGKVDPDPVTGQLTATFRDNPQLPVEKLRLKFKEGPRAPLKTPSTCGVHTTESTLTPWSSPEGADATPKSSFELVQGPAGGACLNGGGLAPYKPAFSGGTMDPTAKAFSPFVLKLSRADGTQQLKAIDTTLPKGLLAKLAGTTYCPDAALAAAAGKSGKAEQAQASCPASSHVGVVNVGAGAGSTPLYVQGQAYLAGPYRGAPLSLAIVTPAVAGPFDLGTVVVRTALQVNSETAQVRAVSDELPMILQGIPLNIRSIALQMNRPQFTLNPTSCNPMSIDGSALSVFNQSAPLTNPFQVGECNRLGFKPKLAIKLKGSTKRAGHPALTATVSARPGDANIATTSVALPKSEFLAQDHIRTICTRVQFAANACPQGSIYGTATATTPLLDEQLTGNVYLRSSSNPLPDMVIALKGKIDVDLVGRIDTDKNGGIRTTFASVPDAPVSKFTLKMAGGKKSLLENSKNLCTSTNKATLRMGAQNGASHEARPVVKSAGCKGKARKGKKRKASKSR